MGKREASLFVAQTRDGKGGLSVGWLFKAFQLCRGQGSLTSHLSRRQQGVKRFGGEGWRDEWKWGRHVKKQRWSESKAEVSAAGFKPNTDVKVEYSPKPTPRPAPSRGDVMPAQSLDSPPKWHQKTSRRSKDSRVGALKNTKLSFLRVRVWPPP